MPDYDQKLKDFLAYHETVVQTDKYIYTPFSKAEFCTLRYFVKWLKGGFEEEGAK